MIEVRNAPVGWWYDGQWHCAAHAEAKFGAALYRLPRPKDRDGAELRPSWRKPGGGQGRSTLDHFVDRACVECSKRFDVV